MIYDGLAAGYSFVEPQLPTVSVKIVTLLLLVHKTYWVNCDNQHWRYEETGQKQKNSVRWKCPNYFCLKLQVVQLNKLQNVQSSVYIICIRLFQVCVFLQSLIRNKIIDVKVCFHASKWGYFLSLILRRSHFLCLLNERPEWIAIHHFYFAHNTPRLSCIAIVSNSSVVLQSSQGKLKAMLMQNFRG